MTFGCVWKQPRLEQLLVVTSMLHKRHRVIQQLYHPQAEHVQPELSMVIDSHGFTPVGSELNQQVTQACKPLRPSTIV